MQMRGKYIYRGEMLLPVKSTAWEWGTVTNDFEFCPGTTLIYIKTRNLETLFILQAKVHSFL